MPTSKSVQLVHPRKGKEEMRTSKKILNSLWNNYNTLQMLTACVIMSLSIYLHHKRTHRTAMLWGTQPIGSCLRSEDWKELIHDLQSPKTETTLWYCEEFHSKTLKRTENTTFAWGLILPILPSFLSSLLQMLFVSRDPTSLNLERTPWCKSAE